MLAGVKTAHIVLNSLHREKDTISASDCLEHLCHSVAKTNPSITYQDVLFFSSSKHVCDETYKPSLRVHKTRSPACTWHISAPRFSPNLFISTWIVFHWWGFSSVGFYACLTAGSVWKNIPELNSISLPKLCTFVTPTLCAFLMTWSKQLQLNIRGICGSGKLKNFTSEPAFNY